VAAHVHVLGAGVAGLATALAVARSGRRVTLVERDVLLTGDVEAAPAWSRKGIPHFLQPHAVIPRGRAELRTEFPDVYADLREHGVDDVDLRPRMPAGVSPDDAYAYIGVRRPVLEWALRRAVRAEAAIEARDGARVTGIRLDDERVSGVEVDGQVVDASVVVDAMGRRSPVRRWLAEAGRPEEPVESSDCGVVYYCRYYRVRKGARLPDGPWLLSPRGDLGYLGFSTFPGDNRTFAALFACPPGVPEWRRFNDPDAFEAAAAQVPTLHSWVDPSLVEPITDVLPMAGLRNSIAGYEPRTALGVVPVGDAYCHTDPVLAHGLSFALVHATAVARALTDHGELADAQAAYRVAVLPALRERYDLATALDEQRLRMWLGQPVDFRHADGDYALFTMVAGTAVASVDPVVAEVFVRRIGLLDSTRVLDDDKAMQRRIEDIFAELAARPRPPVGPSREEMLART
jgi:2-polyprenyl-6-methoxyphenol hydroxylase-like FAD-dependent oxidoreductase